MNRQESFLQHQGQTNQSPYLIDIDRAEGIYIYDKNGKLVFTHQGYTPGAEEEVEAKLAELAK